MELVHEMLQCIFALVGGLLERKQEVIDMRVSDNLKSRRALLCSYHARPAFLVPLIEQVATNTCPGFVPGG